MEHSLVMTVGKVISAHHNPNIITEGGTYRQMRIKSITTCSAALKRLKQTQKAPGLSSALPVKLLCGLKVNDVYNCRSNNYQYSKQNYAGSSQRFGRLHWRYISGS